MADAAQLFKAVLCGGFDHTFVVEPATYLQPGSCVQPLCTLCTVLTSRESQSRVLFLFSAASRKTRKNNSASPLTTFSLKKYEQCAQYARRVLTDVPTPLTLTLALVLVDLPTRETTETRVLTDLRTPAGFCW